MKVANTFLRSAMLSTISIASLAVGSAALAQDDTASPADDAAAEEAVDGSGGIVVTAQRRAEALQNVPISISAFDSEKLEKQQIKNSSDLMLTLPNITFTKTSFTSSSFTIRGVGDLCVGTSCDQASGIHVNGSPVPTTRLFETEFFDLERVEVLRGPQGTLFGRNATSGVVNFVTAKPKLGKFQVSAEGEYGNYNGIKAKAMVNLPIGETLAVRAAGYYTKRDGYTLNLYDNSKIDDRDMYGVRGSVRWEPSENTSLDLMAYYFKEDDNRLRIQKQLCHRDSIGVLGCLPDTRGYEYTNANSQLTSTLPSVQLFRAQGGATLGAAFGALGLVNLTGPDMLAGQVNPADNRVIRTAFTPYYKTSEQQYQASLKHDFGKVAIELTGMYQKSGVDSGLDASQSVWNRGLFTTGLNTLQTYATTGIPGIPGSAAFFAPAAAALIPNGPTGVLCTSVPNTANTGAFGGSKICGQDPINNDRSIVATRSYSGEFLLSSDLEGPFNFLVGSTYLDGKITNNHYNVASFGLDYAGAVLGALTSLGRTLSGATTPPSYLGSTFFDSYTPFFTLKSYGVFGEAYFEPSDKVKFTVGLRYNSDKKHLQARNQLLNFLVPYGTADVYSSPYAAGYDADALSTCAVTGSAVAGAYGSVAGCDAYQLRDAKFDALTGRGVIDFNISPNNLLYASYSRGYKSGGINPPLAAGLLATTTFRPEFVNAFEIGSKNTFAGGALTLNASAFYYQYKGMQLSRIVNRTSVNDNVDADIYGLELEGVIRPSKNFTVNMGASYLKTKVAGDLFVQNPRDPAAGRDDVVIIKDLGAAFNCVVTPATAGNGAAVRQFVTAFNGALGLPGPQAFAAGSGVTATGAHSLCANLASTIANPSAGLRALFATPTGPLPFGVTNVGLTQNIRGKELPQAPNFKWNVGVQYSKEFANGMNIVPRVDLIYVGDSYGNIFNGPINRIRGYSQINAQVQVNGKDDRWYLRGWVQNLTDNDAITGLAVNDQSQGLATNIFTLEPRRYGVTVGIKF